jgi:hypothetical protein
VLAVTWGVAGISNNKLQTDFFNFFGLQEVVWQKIKR